MRCFEKLEMVLENLFEGVFQRNKKRLEPATLARALLRTMRRHSRRGVENVYVPNYYQVQIAADEYQELLPLLSSLAQECAQVLTRQAQERNYQTVGAFVVELESSAELEPGSWEVAVAAFREESPEFLDAHTKRWGAGELLPQFQLRVLEGIDQGKTAPWQDAPLFIGRAVEGGLLLSDQNTSREHARIEKEGSDFFLTDLGSTNGTKVGGKKIQRVRLSAGDVITVGETTLTWEQVASWNG